MSAVFDNTRAGERLDPSAHVEDWSPPRGFFVKSNLTFPQYPKRGAQKADPAAHKRGRPEGVKGPRLNSGGEGAGG